MTGILRRALLPSLEVFLFIIVFALSLYSMPDMLNSDGDLGRHITVGNYILDTGTIPQTDVFSHTRFGAPLVLHEWLSEVTYALAHRAAGLNGVAWLTALLLATIYFTLAAGLRLLGVSVVVAFLAAFAAFVTGMIHHLPRPHLFTLLLFTIFVLLLEAIRRGQAGRFHGRDMSLRTDFVKQSGVENAEVASSQNSLLAMTVPASVESATAVGATEQVAGAERTSARSVLWQVGLSVVVVVLWANLNGAFILAYMLLGIYIVGALLERQPRSAGIFALLLILAFLAALVNPYGITLTQHVAGFMGNRFLVDNTVEYLSPNFHNVSALPFAAWIAFSIVLFGRLSTRVSWTPLLLLGAWTAFGLYSARNIANYAQVAAIVTAPAAETWLATAYPPIRVRLQNLDAVAPVAGGWVWLVVVSVLLIFLQAGGVPLDARSEGNQFTNRAFPVDAVNFVEQNPPGERVFNEYTWGGYLEYRLFPSQRVFIDGDNDFFGAELVREYLDVINGREGWETILDKYAVDWVIVPPQRELAEELARSNGWREIYRDEGAVVWVRQE